MRSELKEPLLPSTSTLKEQLTAAVGNYHSLLSSTQNGPFGAFAFFHLFLLGGAKESTKLLEKLRQCNNEEEAVKIATTIFSSSNDALKLIVALRLTETGGSKTIFPNIDELRNEAKTPEAKQLIALTTENFREKQNELKHATEMKPR